MRSYSNLLRKDVPTTTNGSTNISQTLIHKTTVEMLIQYKTEIL